MKKWPGSWDGGAICNTCMSMVKWRRKKGECIIILGGFYSLRRAWRAMSPLCPTIGSSNTATHVESGRKSACLQSSRVSPRSRVSGPRDSSITIIFALAALACLMPWHDLLSYATTSLVFFLSARRLDIHVSMYEVCAAVGCVPVSRTCTLAEPEPT